MAISLIQARGAATQGVNPVSQAFNSVVTAGSLLVATTYVRDTTVGTVTDTNGNTWQQAGDWSGESLPDSTRFAYIWYAMNANAGGATVSVNSSGAGGIDLAIHEFGGLAATAALDVVHYQGQNGTNLSTDTVTTTKTANELLVAFAVTRDAVNTGTTADSFTVAVEDPNFNGGQSKYRIVSSLNTYGPATFVTSGAQASWMGIASFAVTAAGFTNTAVPFLTTTSPAVDGTIHADPGTWTPTPSSYNYFWERADDAAGTNRTPVGSTASTYTLVAADSGKVVHAGVIPVA